MTGCTALIIGYRYTDSLWKLDCCRRYPEPEVLWARASPLKWHEWQFALRNHPDREFVRYLVEGIKEGFRVQGCRKHLESGEALKPHPATPIATPYLVTVIKIEIV